MGKLRSTTKRSKAPSRVTYETVRQIALSLSNVEEGLSYGAPAFKVKQNRFVRLRDDLDSIVIKMPFGEREALMAANPAAYYITDHYAHYQWRLVRLSEVHADALPQLLQAAHEFAAASRSR